MIYDIAIVGCGPVGQTLAALLGQRGHKVAVIERQTGLYPLSRAGHIDDEICRVLQKLGVVDDFLAAAQVIDTYDWVNAAGERLVHFDWSSPSLSGWPAHVSFYTPRLERLLMDKVATLADVDVFPGVEVQAVEASAESVTLGIRAWAEGARVPGAELQARYVVGTDGANSIVRKATGMGWDDLGFSADWLVVDFKPHDPQIALPGPHNLQRCDPARPVSYFRHLGRDHIRWEFMLLPGETIADMADERRVLELMAPWVKPADGEIIRRAVYTFQSRLAQHWRQGRVLLAGDAAHLMPPFLGQGMCSGMRDAVNLDWKLDLVLRGVAAPALLDSYEPERKPQVGAVIALAVELGKIICIADPAEAAGRDAFLLSGQAPPPPPLPGIVGGLVSADGHPLAGQLTVQGEVGIDGRRGRLDDLIGPGWALLTFDAGVIDRLQAVQGEALERIGARLVRLVPAGTSQPNSAEDLQGRYAAFFAEHDIEYLIVRPDFYAHAAGPVVQFGAAVQTLIERLGLTPPQPA